MNPCKHRFPVALALWLTLWSTGALAQAGAPVTPPANAERTVRWVTTGDTLSQIATALKPAGVTLEQALVGLFRANPEAFIGQNMNQLKSGVSLSMPSAAGWGATPAAEARTVVRTQFDEWTAARNKAGGRFTQAPPRRPAAPSPVAVAAPIPAAKPEAKAVASPAKPETPTAATAAPSRHAVIEPPLPRLADLAAGQIEVVEYFWYGCPHCFEMEPLIHAWAGRLPADVTVRRLPAILGMLSEPGARLYFTLEALGQAERLHGAVFEAIHREGRLQAMSSDEEKYADWAASKNIDKAAFLSAWQSAAVSARMKQAAEWSKAFRARKLGVPLLVVEGRWATNATLTDNDEHAVLPEVDGLIATARAARPKN